MEYKDYYHIMGVPRDAKQDEIKRAYRRLARKYHPDVSKEANAEAHFKDVNEAYEVLKDPEKRAAYDKLGAHWKAGQEFKPPPGWSQGFEFRGGGFTGADSFGFSDFFESLFGRRVERSQRTTFPARGEDTHATVAISVEDAYLGSTRTLTLQHTAFDNDGLPHTKSRSLNVHIPIGVHPGQHIRLAGQGGPGIGGGSPGDLYLQVQFRPHPLYKVEGKDVYLDLPVAPWEAALGTTVQAPTPTGAVELKIPAGSANGRKLRIKGRGIPGHPAGDFYVALRVALPPADSEAAKELYREMARTCPFDPRAHMGR